MILEELKKYQLLYEKAYIGIMNAIEIEKSKQKTLLPIKYKDMKEKTYNEKVEEFMITFNQKIPLEPIIPSKDIIDLRLSLILEELTELAEACGSDVLSDFGLSLIAKGNAVRDKVEKGREFIKPDLTEVLDALIDLQYVLSGAVQSFGMSFIFNDAFEEVHQSNMSKACNNEQEVLETIEKYKKDGILVDAFPSGDYCIIMRREDKKVLKSINYKPANLKRFITDEI